MRYVFKPMDYASAERMIRWRYAPPYGMYNINAENIDAEIGFFTDPANQYYALLTDDGELVAFCCFGDDARVPGGEYDVDATDIGMGVRPDLTGKGQGHQYIELVLDFARKQFDVKMFRATIAEFNTRALRLCYKAGFEPFDVFQRDNDGKNFVILVTKEFKEF